MSVIKPPPLLYYPDFYPDPAWLRAVLLLNDEVKRIIPTDVKVSDPEALKEIAGELGALTSISPDVAHVNFDQNVLGWLEKAFSILVRDLPAERIINISPSGNISYLGRVLLYDQKISEPVRSLLQKYGLVDHLAEELLEKLGKQRGTTMVYEGASNLILSIIADNGARDFGFTPITDQPLDFAMNTLRGLQVSARAPAGASEGQLAEAFTSVLIPKDIGAIRFQDYRILREHAEDLRIAFGKFVQQCHDTCRLNRIENASELNRKVAECAAEVEREFKKFRKSSSKALRILRDWWPITIGGFVSICGRELFSPMEATLLPIVAQGVKITEKLFVSNPDYSKERAFGLAAELGSNIRSLGKVKELLSEDA